MVLSPKNSEHDNYPVNMIPFSDGAISALRQEMMFVDKCSKKNYLNIPAAFDTETSSFIDEQDFEESAILYIWQFGINNTVVYGRELDELVALFDAINDYLLLADARLIVYTHFLKYDFSFIKRMFKWDHVFSKKNRDVLYATYGRIEIRDSLALAGGQGLAKIGKNLRRKTLKAEGDLCYSLIRHSKTPLTQAEMHYCEMDIRVLCEYIREKIEDDGDISKIPFTNTGYVRNYMRNECFKDRKRYTHFIDGLTMTPDCYMQCELAYAGGAVGPNIRWNGLTIQNVHSYDIKSSYPYVMVAKYFPINFFTPLPKVTVLRAKNYMQTHCCLFTLEVWGLQPKTDYCFPISYSKCIETIGETTASGRVLTAAYVKINVTELDFFTFERFYDLSDIRISNFRISPRGYLPYPIINSVITFFNKKTTLDGVPGMKAEYMISKNMLNSCYGMMVEKPVRPIFGYVNTGDFTQAAPDYVLAVDEYNNKWNRFLFYPWGVWVTAHARYRLYDAIYNVGDDYIYCDTDSVKFVGNHSDYFDRINNDAKQDILAVADRYNIPVDYIAPHSPDGSQKWLGVWEHEYDAVNFKTIGAKRYLLQLPNGEYELTVAGTNKSGSLAYILQYAAEQGKTPFQVFDENLVIPPEYARRTISKFIDRERTGWVTDYLGNKAYYVSPSGIYTEPASYTFSITEEMKQAVIWLSHDGHWQDGQLE